MTRSRRLAPAFGGLFSVCFVFGLSPDATQLQAAQDGPPKPGDSALQSSQVQPATEDSAYIRVKRDEDNEPISLQTATARFTSAAGEGDLVVDLISVVHIADEAYYRALNDQFERYDVVLYELVAPEGMEVPDPDREEESILSMIQEFVGVALDLDHQMDHIDYKQANFVHADLSPDEMAEAMSRRGEDAITLTLGVTADLLRQANLQAKRQDDAPPTQLDEEIDPLALLMDADGPIQIKRMMAEQFAAMGDPAAGLGRTLETILIDDRNEAAMRVFQQQMAAGKKRIAIFFGAGHMPDFETRLARDFGLKRAETTWHTAWDLREGTGEDPLIRLMKMLDDIDID